jgi:hypothetical protein
LSKVSAAIDEADAAFSAETVEEPALAASAG